MAVDSSPTSDTAVPNAPRQPAAIKDSPSASSVGTCPSPQLPSETAVSSSSEKAPSAQFQASMSTVGISQRDSDNLGTTSLDQSAHEEPHLGSPLRGADNNLPSAVSKSSSTAERGTSVSRNDCLAHPANSQREDKESLTTIEAQKQAEVSTSAVTHPSKAHVGTATVHAPLCTASASGETQASTISGDSPGHHAAVSPRPSSSGSSSSAVSLPGTPAPPHELRPPHPPTQARGDGNGRLPFAIIRQADGLRLENCPRGSHVAIYAPNNVQVTLEHPARTVSSFGQVSDVRFQFKVMEDGGICVLRMPEGTKASGMVVPTVQGREEGAQGGGVIVEQIFTAVDGYTVTFRFAL